MGKKKQPMYRVVAADSRSPRDGKFLESIGSYNPLSNPHTVQINEERAFYWLNKGAQPTDTVKSLLRQKGIILKHHLTKKGLSEDKINEELEKWNKIQEVKSSSSADKKVKKKAAEEKAEEEAKKIEESTTEVKGATSDENPSGEES
jgi:small subunit ribosomal protein S16